MRSDTLFSLTICSVLQIRPPNSCDTVGPQVDLYTWIGFHSSLHKPQTSHVRVSCCLVQGSRNTSTIQVGDGPSEPVDSTDEATIRQPADQEVLDAVSKKSSADVPKSLDAFRVEVPDSDQSLHAGLNHDVGVSSVEVGTSMRSPEAPPSVKDGEDLPNVESTGGGQPLYSHILSSR